MSENTKSQKEQAIENVALLKAQVANILKSTGRPLRDLFFERLNERMKGLGNLNLQPQKQQQPQNPQPQPQQQQPQREIQCPECGTWNPAGSTVCSRCEYPLDRAARQKAIEKDALSLSHLSISSDQ
jgi:ribosomal protein L40E